MKKRKAILMSVMVMLISLSCYFYKSNKDSVDLLNLQNVEALAFGEGWTMQGFSMEYSNGCYVCRFGGPGSGTCEVSDQCCKSWGDC